MSTLKSLSFGACVFGLATISGIVAAGFGFHFAAQMRNEAQVAATREQRVASAQAQLVAGAKAMRDAARTRSPGSPSAAAGNVAADSADATRQVAYDLQIRHWQEQVYRANFVLRYGAYFRSKGLSADQLQQVAAAAVKLSAEMNDVREIAHLAGVDLSSNPELLARAQQARQQYASALTSLIGPDNTKDLEADLSGQNAPSQNPRQAAEANYVATQVAGLAIATPSPLTAPQRTQLLQLIVNNEPNYQPGDNNNMDTINWDGLISQADGVLPADQVSILKSLQAMVARDTLVKQAQQVAVAKGPP